MNPANVHVYKEHRTDGVGCWCNPRYQMACEECDAADGFSSIADEHGFDRLHANQDGPEDLSRWQLTGCWKCDHGWVDISAEQAQVASVPLIVIRHP